MKYKYDVFISYSRRDYVDESYNVIPGNAIAEIQNVFDENGITYWFDKDGIYSGQEFIEIITGAIAESKILIFISSKHSNESMWTAGEIFEALDGEKAIIPVKIDNSQYNKKFKLLIILAIINFYRDNCFFSVQGFEYFSCSPHRFVRMFGGYEYEYLRFSYCACDNFNELLSTVNSVFIEPVGNTIFIEYILDFRYGITRYYIVAFINVISA